MTALVPSGAGFAASSVIKGGCVSSPSTQAMARSARTGVAAGSLLVSRARYWRNCALAPIGVPEAGSVTKSLQLPSGKGVSPVRTAMLSPVPAGSSLFQVASDQSAGAPPS